MAYLNQQERDQMAQDLKDKTRQQIRGYVTRRDSKTRLAFWRNAQESGKWMTRYVLPTLGTVVTIYESVALQPKGFFNKRDYTIEQIVVEPTPNNRT